MINQLWTGGEPDYPSSMRRGSSMYSLIWEEVSGPSGMRTRGGEGTDLDEESDSLATIQKAMIVRESEVHHLWIEVSMRGR